MILVDFLKRLIKDAQRKGVQILDNLRVHHARKVKEWLQGREDQIELFFLPAYSPELNPDEYLNCDLKAGVYSGKPARSKDQLKKKVISHMRMLRKKSVRVKKYFKHEKIEVALFIPAQAAAQEGGVTWTSRKTRSSGDRTDGYGDPQLAGGPERFCDAYRHIIDIFRAEAATKLTWIFHVNADSEPVVDWNSMAAYYPGDDYIDWIGVSVYNGSWVCDEDLSFREILDRAWPELTDLSSDRPIAVLELGMSEQR